MNFSGDMPKPPPANTFRERARRFGIFLRQRLDKQRLTRAEFANRLDMDEELVDALLNGEFPLSQIGDGLVAAMGVILELEPDLLRIIIQRPEQTIMDTVETASDLGEDIHATLESFRIMPGNELNGQHTRHGLDNVGTTLALFQAEDIQPKRPLTQSPLEDPTKTLDSFLQDNSSFPQTGQRTDDPIA